MAPRIRVEVAFEVVVRASVAVLRRFREVAGTWPDLRLSTDVEALGPLLHVRGVLRSHPGLTGYDVASGLLRSLLESASYSPLADVGPVRAATLADGLIGRVYYNPPSREFEFRQHQLMVLQAEGDEEMVTDTVVWVTEYLRAANQIIRDGIETSETMRKQLVDWFSNPYLWLETRFREYYLADGRGLVGLADYYDRIAESAKGSCAHYE